MGSRAAAAVLLLLLVVGAGIWYLALGGREFLETKFLGKEAVEVELAFTHTPVASSPLKDVKVDISVSARRVRIGPGVEFKKPIVREGPEDKIRAVAPGAEVYFRKAITIYDEEGNLLFNRTMEFTKGADRTITIYVSADEVRGDKLVIIVDIYIRVELPTPPGKPAPSAIEVSIHREIETNIQR